jgi:ankyrin repeat protein
LTILSEATHMSLKRIIGASAVALGMSVGSLGAARSDVADAVMKGDKAAVHALLQQHTDVNTPQADGTTALHWAVYRDDVEMADLLIQAGAKVQAANREGATPLFLASVNGKAVMIEKLLKGGADPNLPVLPHGETALMMAARTGNVDAIKTLLDYGADVDARESLRGTTALMWAAEQEHPSAVGLLTEYGADVSARSNPATLGRSAYLAPTVRQRTATVGIEGAPARAGAGRGRGPADGSRGGRGADGAAAAAQDFDNQDFFAARQNTNGGGLTPLVYAARQGDLESTRILIAAGADVNQVTQYGWTPLLTATHNRYYRLASFLLAHGADPNVANKGGWTPLYLATDNRNIEGGDYPVRKPDMDHLDYIQKLLDYGADVNARAKDSTETRTIFTMQWLYEDGATPFLRAAQSGDATLMRLLLAHGADPKIATATNVTALAVAAGIGWVEGVTYEWSEKENLEAVQMCLDLGIDINTRDGDGRTALHGAAHKGRNAVVQLLVDHGAKLDAKDNGSRDTVNGALLGHGWLPLDYADGLVRVGVQSAIAHPDTAALLRKLMTNAGVAIPPPITSSVCITPVCK